MDIDNVFAERRVTVGLVFHPETESFVAHLVLAQHGHEEVFGYDEPLTEGGQYLAAIVYGSAFADVQRVTKIVLIPRSYLCFHVLPNSIIESVYLWHHVGEIEGLDVGFSRPQAVGRGTDVAVVVACTPERISVKLVGRGEYSRRVGIGWYPIGSGWYGLR